MRKVLSAILALAIVVTLLPINVFASEVSDNEPYCSLNPTISIKEIVNVEVIDNEIYIDVIENNNISLDYSVGKCKAPYKYTTRTVSRSELVDMQNQIKNTTDILGTIVGFCVGLANPVAGSVSGILIANSEYKLQSEISNALKKNKSSYTIKTKLKCEEGNMGSRGIVHRYKVENVSIY